MKYFVLVLIIFLEFYDDCSAQFYEETLNEMLLQCNIHQNEVRQEDRVRHICEKPDFDDDFSYFISPLETQFSKRKFLCLSFFKDDQLKLKFKLWFSHSNYTVNAVSHLIYEI